MKNIVKQYTHSIAWSAIEAIIFQTVLCAHQAALFAIVSSQLYGFTGTVFGLIYFTVKLLDFGLCKSLITFYHEFSLDKRSFLLFFAQQLLPNVIFCCILFFFVWITYIFFNHYIFATIPFNGYLLAIACGLVITESIKTILKRLLQLSYNFRCAALYEIGFIVSYPLTLWSYYFYTGSLHENVIIGFCFLISLLETIGLSIALYRHYALLPLVPIHNNIPFVSQYTVFHIYKSRFFIYGHSMSKQLCSGNILIPLCAYIYGLEYAALLKLASYITHSIATVMEKIIDPSSSLLFIHAKKDSLENKQQFFLLALRTSWHILLCMLIFILINGITLFTASHASFVITPYIVVYFLIHYCENFFIAIEKFYIAHDHSRFLIIGTILNSAIALLVFANFLSPLIALMLFLISRIITLIILLYCLSYIWNISPRIQIIPRYIVGSIVLSIFCKIIF